MEYDKIYNTIVEYIKYTIKSDIKINDHVPNTHIAEVFKEVLGYLELENMYYVEFHDTINDRKIDIIKYLGEDDYFDRKKLRADKEDEIHRVYQILRGKRDPIRNNMMLSNIVLSSIIMPHKSKRDLKSDKIKIKKHE